MVKAVIFDMDGVLVDSEGYFLELFNDMFRRHGAVPDQEILNKTVGTSTRQCWDILASMWPEPISESDLLALFHEEYPVFSPEYDKLLYPEVKDVLHQLKDAGYTLALASSTQMELIQKMLTLNGLEEFFSVVVTGHMFKRSKPDPEIYLYTANELGLDPADCVAIEDSTYGILAGKHAGMTVIARRDDRYGFDRSEADAVVNDLSELPQLLEELNN